MKLFEMNVGRLDRLVRIAIGGSVVIYGAALLAMPLNLVAIAAGLILLATGLMGTCTLYSLLGINTGGKAAAAPAKKARKK